MKADIDSTLEMLNLSFDFDEVHYCRIDYDMTLNGDENVNGIIALNYGEAPRRGNPRYGYCFRLLGSNYFHLLQHTYREGIKQIC